MIHPIVIAAMISALVLAVEHWFPWRMLIGRALPRMIAYIIGVLALLIPISVVWLLSGQREIVLQLWAVVVASGAMVALVYGIDWLLGRIAQARDLEKIQELLDGRYSTGRETDA